MMSRKVRSHQFSERRGCLRFCKQSSGKHRRQLPQERVKFGDGGQLPRSTGSEAGRVEGCKRRRTKKEALGGRRVVPYTSGEVAPSEIHQQQPCRPGSLALMGTGGGKPI